MSPPGTVPVSGPGRPGGPTGDRTGPGFLRGPTGHHTGPGFLGGGPTGHRTGPGFETGFLFFFVFEGRRERKRGMSQTQEYSVTSEEVLQVENKCPFLPITPTYDQYVQ